MTPDEPVASWARKPIETGQPDSPFLPLVLGPKTVPRIADAETAKRAPEQALLSAFAHGAEPGALDVAVAALAGAAGLDDERAVLYCDLVHLAVGESVRRQLEELMEKGTYEFQSEFARKYLAKGEARGRAEGEARGRAEALMTLLAARKIPIAAEVRARILACRDIPTLDRWIARAASATSVADVFADD